MKNMGTFYTKEELLNLGIYELRELGRDVGVVSPTTLKKERLVDEILKVIYGQTPKREIGKGRGRPARNRQKPCKVFTDLIEQIEAPVVKTSFIYEGKNGSSFDYSYLGQSMVASPKEAYSVDKDQTVAKLTRGVVCVEQNGNYVRKLKFVHSDEDLVLPKKLIEDYDLHDNDLVEVLPAAGKNEVEQVVKVNGNLASKVMAGRRKGRKLAVESIEVADSYTLLTNQSNILYAPTKQERTELFECVCRVLEKRGYSLVRVCFDQTLPDNSTNSLKTTSIYATAVGDEYDTIAMAETAVERIRFMDRTEEKTALIIDNLGWLSSVIDTYPKSLYGNFIYKLSKLPDAPSANITVVCLTGHLAESKASEFAAYFDNIVVPK